MRSHIITLTSIVCFTATTTTALAQDVEEKKETTNAPKLVLGANLGMGTAAMGATYLTDKYFKGNAGVFARYYFGKHLAVEGGFNYGIEVYKVKGSLYMNNVELQSKNLVNRFSTYSVPVQLQYHLLEPGSKIRPYFGLGMGVIHKEYYSNYDDNIKKLFPSRTSGFVSFTQGVTWQLTPKWQINQSLSVIQGLNDTKPTIDFRIGVGYSLFNK